MDSLQGLLQGKSSDTGFYPPFVRTLCTSLSPSKLVARSLHIARHQVLHASDPGHLAHIQGFVFDMDAITLGSGAPVTRILAECTPNIVQVEIFKISWKIDVM